MGKLRGNSSQISMPWYTENKNMGRTWNKGAFQWSTEAWEVSTSLLLFLLDFIAKNNHVSHIGERRKLWIATIQSRFSIKNERTKNGTSREEDSLIPLQFFLPDRNRCFGNVSSATACCVVALMFLCFRQHWSARCWQLFRFEFWLCIPMNYEKVALGLLKRSGPAMLCSWICVTKDATMKARLTGDGACNSSSFVKRNPSGSWSQDKQEMDPSEDALYHEQQQTGRTRKQERREIHFSIFSKSRRHSSLSVIAIFNPASKLHSSNDHAM